MKSLLKDENYKPIKISDNLKQKIFGASIVLKDFYNRNNGNIHISFSGGLDSTVALHIARSIYPNIKAVHLDTMQEYKGIKELVSTINNVDIIRPSMTFTEVVNTFGYPLVSKKISRIIYDLQNPNSKNLRTRQLSYQKKFVGDDGIERPNSYYFSVKHRYLLDENIPITHKCCIYTKEKPLKEYRKKNKEGAVIGLLAEESTERKKVLNKPCINEKSNTANIFKDWTKQDIFEYIVTFNLKYAVEYGTIYYDEVQGKFLNTGLKRTGCKGCLFGANKEEAIRRMNILKDTDIKSYNAFMLGGKEDSKGFLRPYKGFGYKKIIDKLK